MGTHSTFHKRLVWCINGGQSWRSSQQRLRDPSRLLAQVSWPRGVSHFQPRKRQRGGKGRGRLEGHPSRPRPLWTPGEAGVGNRAHEPCWGSQQRGLGRRGTRQEGRGTGQGGWADGSRHGAARPAHGTPGLSPRESCGLIWSPGPSEALLPGRPGQQCHLVVISAHATRPPPWWEKGISQHKAPQPCTPLGQRVTFSLIMQLNSGAY